MAAAMARSGSRRLFSISAFVSRKLPTPPLKAKPFPNLFVPGLSKQTTIGGLREAFPMRSRVQVLETASCRNVGKGCVLKTQCGRTLPRTLRKQKLRAPGCPFREAFPKSGEVEHAPSLKNSRWYMINSNRSGSLTTRKECHKVLPSSIRSSASYSSQASEDKPKQEKTDLTTIEDPFDAPTYNIPEKPVTFAEGASYSVVILAGLGVAAMAGYAVFKELIFEPKEYKIFGKALARVQSDSQVTAKIGYPITGYGTESRNRAARQRIQNRVWTDEDGVEHVEVGFHIRGPHGAGKVFAEMFKDNSDRTWKFTFLLVEITSPRHAQMMLESYIPA